MVEDLALPSLGRGNEVLVEDGEDVIADVGELGLDLGPVGLDLLDLGRVALALLLLLNRGDDSPRRTASANDLRARVCKMSGLARAREIQRILTFL